MLVQRFSALLAALMVLSARLMNSVMLLVAVAGLRSDTGEISIFRILRFSSSAIGLTDLLLGIGDVEPEQ